MSVTVPDIGYVGRVIDRMSVAGLLFSIPPLVLLYLLVKIIYRLYFHPLSKYPGPRLAAATRLWYAYKIIQGDLAFEVSDLHAMYGPVVRVAPDELAFIGSAAWNDIYGFRSGKPEMVKDSPFYTSDSMPPGIISAKRDKHAHFRRLMSRGFSDAALREQQPIIMGYVDLLMQRLREATEKGKSVEMTSWYNFLTFDIIGDLAFGEPFGCLASSEYHPWVKLIFDSIHLLCVNQALSYYPSINRLIPYITPKHLAAKYESHNEMTREKALRRKESKLDRADFVSNLIKPENNISDAELVGNSSVLIIAGSETTATLLSGVTWFLGRHPDALKKLTAEVRSSFKNVSEIDFTSVSQLKYLLGCLNEGLRLFPPTPTGLARVVPKGGDMIDGNWVPGGTQVSIYTFAANRSPMNFLWPEDFIPERWTDDPRFINDDRAAMQPFSYGPRNCLGKNLAYVEMRLVLARLLWEFDFELCEGLEDWNKVPIYVTFEKKPLWVTLKPVVRT